MLTNRRWLLMLSAPCKKKARFSPGKNGAVDVTTHNPNNVRSPFRQLQPSPTQLPNLPSFDRRWNDITSARPEKRKVFRRPPVSCDSVSITRMDGQRLYLSIKGDRDEESLAQSKVNCIISAGLLFWTTPGFEIKKTAKCLERIFTKIVFWCYLTCLLYKKNPCQVMLL